MVKWVVGDSVDYEVNGTWYPGYIARSDSKTLYFKYEASQFQVTRNPSRRRAATTSRGSARARAAGPRPPPKRRSLRHVSPRPSLQPKRRPLRSPPPANPRRSPPPRSRASPASMMAHRRRRPVPDAGPRRSRPRRRRAPRRNRPPRNPRPGPPARKKAKKPMQYTRSVRSENATPVRARRTESPQ